VRFVVVVFVVVVIVVNRSGVGGVLSRVGAPLSPPCPLIFPLFGFSLLSVIVMFEITEVRDWVEVDYTVIGVRYDWNLPYVKVCVNLSSKGPLVVTVCGNSFRQSPQLGGVVSISERDVSSERGGEE
jgi:hypothetical protein